METGSLERKGSVFFPVGGLLDVVDHSNSAPRSPSPDVTSLEITARKETEKSNIERSKDLPFINVGRYRTTTETQFADTEVCIHLYIF